MPPNPKKGKGKSGVVNREGRLSPAEKNAQRGQKPNVLQRIRGEKRTTVKGKRAFKIVTPN